MRVMVVGINYAPDLIGVAKYTTELCESLTARGHEVRVVTAPPYYPDWKVPAEYRSVWYRRETVNHVDITRAPIYVPAKPSGLKRLIHHGSFLVSAAAPVLSMALTWRPDIVFAVAPSLLSAPLAALAARVSGAASWLHVQDMEVDAAFELGLLKKQVTAQKMMFQVERSIMRQFDRVSSISPQMVTCLEQKGLAPERLREFRNWIDTSTITPGSSQTRFRTRLGLKSTDVVALYSGAMSNKQGLELIVDAARSTGSSHPSLHFVLCGNGPIKPALVQMAGDLGNVHFLDLQPKEDVCELLRTADIHLLPQKVQVSDLVLPSKLAGMLASGRPVLAMALPGTGIAREVEGAGMLVAPGDAQALGAAVVALAADAGLRTHLGAVARSRAEKNWDRVAIIRALEREFMSLPQRTPVTAPVARHTVPPTRSIEQMSFGSRRRPESVSRVPTVQPRKQARGAVSAGD